MTVNRKAKQDTRAEATQTGRSYTHVKRVNDQAAAGIRCPSCGGEGSYELDNGEVVECLCEGRGWLPTPAAVERAAAAAPPTVFGPVNTRQWNDPESGIEDRWPHWREEQRRHEAGRALSAPSARAWHLSGRWTSPRRGGLYYRQHGDTERLLALLYAVVLWESPDLDVDDPTRAWLLQHGSDDRALAMIDAACHDLDRAARMLAGQHAGDSRHSPGTDERIAAYLAADPRRDQTMRHTHDKWRSLHTPILDSEGYEHVILPWSATRQVLDAVLIRASGGMLPGTPVRVISGPHAGADSNIDTAWWAEDAEAPTGYILSGGMVGTEPFAPERLAPNPPDHSVTKSYLRQQAARAAADGVRLARP